MFPEYLSITEMARQRDVSTETLRHYDRIGLLKPDYVNEHGMRFYSTPNCEKLQTIKELKQIGMKLSEIQQYFQNRTFSTSYELIEMQNQILKQKISELKAIQKQVQQKRAYMRTITPDSYNTEIFFKEFPDRYYISSHQNVHTDTEISSHAMRLENFVYKTEKYSPLYATTRYGALIPVNDLTAQSTERELIIFIDPKKASQIEHCEKIPSGTFCCARGTGHFSGQDDTIKNIIDYVKQQNLTPRSSYMIENVIVDHSITDVMEERLFEFQLRI